MGMTDKQFGLHARHLLRDLKEALEALDKNKPENEKTIKILSGWINDLQSTLED